MFITEKSSVAENYCKTLGLISETAEWDKVNKSRGYIEGNSPVMKDNVIVTWAAGHLVSLCNPDKQNPDWGGNWSKDKLPMIPEIYKYEPILDIDNKRKQYENVKAVYTRPDITAIYYAGDSGREGIYIQALIRNQIFKTAPKFEERVVWISSYSKPAILKGIEEAKTYADYQPLIDSGYARAIADWEIGMNFTQAFTLTSRQLINTGRVVTPTLAMIVNRQNEIDNFKKTYFYGIQADGVSWKAVEGSKFFESDLLYNENGFYRKDDAEKLMNECNQDKKLIIDNVEVKEKAEYAPLLFSLANLQTYCSKAFNISPAETLEIAQELYEGRYTTYPRTDTSYLDSKTQSELKSHGYNIPNHYVNDSKVTDHYAIIPDINGNGLSGAAASLSGIKRSVYQAIEKRFLDTMKPLFVYDAVSIRYKHSNGEFFFNAFRNVKQLGWREGENIDTVQTPVPSIGSVVPVTEFSIRNMETKPPVPYTTGTLVDAMDKVGRLVDDEEMRNQLKACKGIGTPATRADIIERLEKKGFITVDSKQKITPTDLGKAVVPMVAAFDETLVSPIKTAEMEMELDKMQNGEVTIDDYLNEVNEYVRETTAKILTSQNVTLGSGGGSGKTYPCPKCKGDVVFGKFGWYCKDKCGFYPKQKVFGHELSDKAVEALLSGKSAAFTVDGKKTVVLPKIAEQVFNGKTYYNWQTQASENAGSGKTYTCPKCGGDILSGKFGWYCKDKCGFYPKQKIYGHELTDTQVENLLAGKEASFTVNGKKTIVIPAIEEREFNGKTYYNWQTKKG